MKFWVGLALGAMIATAYAQSNKFQPGANPVSNQSFDAAVVTVGTALSQVSRALWVGDVTACSITVTMNSGASVTYQNVLDQWMPIQVRNVTASTCTAGTIIATF
jgi:hypothetical protein